MARMSGVGYVRAADSALILLALRQIQLVAALSLRGHGAVKPVDMSAADEVKTQRDTARRIVRRAARARQYPDWSGLNGEGGEPPASARRDAMAEDLATRIDTAVKASMP